MLFRSRLASVMGQESLFIYIAHLVIVYGSVVNQGLAQSVGPTLNIANSAGVFLAILAGIMVVTMFWHKLKTDYSSVASIALGGSALLFLFEFVRRPW